jgi:hypothetical protein
MRRLAVPLSLMLLAVPAVLAVPVARAADAPRRDRPAWAFTLGVGVHHDDNILQLSGRNLDRLATDPGLPRFRIAGSGDQVFDLSAGATLRARPIRRRETRLEATAEADRYADSGVADWHHVGIATQQELTATRRTLTTVRAWADALPRYYLGEITDDDDSFAAGRRIRRSLTYAQTTLGARLEQRVARAELAVTVERSHRDYDAHFDERDGDDERWRLALGGVPSPRAGVRLGVALTGGRYDATGDLAASPIRDDDVSHDHHGFAVSAGVPWGHGPSRGRIDIEIAPETRRYTTADPFDVLRHGRENHRVESRVRVTQRAWGPLDAVATWDRTTSDAAFPAGAGVVEDEYDFDQSRFGVMLRGRWDVRGH